MNRITITGLLLACMATAGQAEELEPDFKLRSLKKLVGKLVDATARKDLAGLLAHQLGDQRIRAIAEAREMPHLRPYLLQVLQRRQDSNRRLRLAWDKAIATDGPVRFVHVNARDLLVSGDQVLTNKLRIRLFIGQERYTLRVGLLVHGERGGFCTLRLSRDALASGKASGLTGSLTRKLLEQRWPAEQPALIGAVSKAIRGGSFASVATHQASAEQLTAWRSSRSAGGPPDSAYRAYLQMLQKAPQGMARLKAWLKRHPGPPVGSYWLKGIFLDCPGGRLFLHPLGLSIRGASNTEDNARIWFSGLIDSGQRWLFCGVRLEDLAADRKRED